MIFIDNKYTRWYYNIINNAKFRNLTGYTEKHHIIPKSCGGSNSKDNLVALTAKEHFICHLLLVRMVEGNFCYKMAYALNRMLTTNSNNQVRYIPTSRKFEKVRLQISNTLKGHSSPMKGRRHSEETKKKLSEIHKGKSSLLKGRPKSEETKKKMSEARKGYKMPDSTKKKLSEFNKGKSYSDEYKKKMSERNKGLGFSRTLSDETKKKISDIHRGKTISDDHKDKIRQHNLERVFTPEQRELIAEKISKAHKGKKISEEHKQKRRLALQNKPIIKCPHCSYVAKDSAALRKWHFKNCKFKTD